MTMYWLLPVIDQAAWFCPVNVPLFIVGNQSMIDGLGLPAQSK